MNYKSPILTISLLSILGGIAVMAVPEVVQFGMSSYPATPFHRILQFLLYGILHGGILHILSNVLFFYLIGTTIEKMHGRSYVWGLWIFTTLFVGVILMYYSRAFTIGASGFAMALLSVFALDLYRRRHQDFRGALLLIAINIFVGLGSDVSLLGHLSGAIAGAIYGIIRR